jgi:hypothetical protein
MEASIMKLAKTLAILFALVMVVICFNAPAVFSGEEHPWDQEGGGGRTTGGGSSTGGGLNPDTVKIGASSTKSIGPREAMTKFTGSFTAYERLLVTFNFVIWYRDIPVQSRSSNREARIITTCVGAR